MMLYYILVGSVLASSYCRADEVVKRSTVTVEQRLQKLENELEYGGKQYHTVPHSELQLKDHNYLRLQFMGARIGWLGCALSVCDLRTCPSFSNRYRDFEACGGEVFQIIGEGTHGRAITSGQRIRLRYLNAYNSWMGCPWKHYCDKQPCPGTTSQAANFRRCGGEIFRIYARGRANGQIIYNGDLVMLYYPVGGRYVSIQGQNEGDDTSLNFCPGLTPPAYLSYGICSKNVFRIYRKP